MTKRSQEWSEGLANDLRDVAFARAFVMGLLEEGFTLQEALAKTIRAQGVKEFAKRVQMPSANVLRAIRPNHNPSQKVLERLLRPLPRVDSFLSTPPFSGVRA